MCRVTAVKYLHVFHLTVVYIRFSFVIDKRIVRVKNILRGSLMKRTWLKLASLDQKFSSLQLCSSCFNASVFVCIQGCPGKTL